MRNLLLYSLALLLAVIVISTFIQRNTFIYFTTANFKVDNLDVKYQYKHDPFNCWLDCPMRRKITFSNGIDTRSIVMEMDFIGYNHIIFKEVVNGDNSLILVEDLQAYDFIIDQNTLETKMLNWCNDSFSMWDTPMDVYPICEDSLNLGKCYGILYLDSFLLNDCGNHF